jgi:hypothetical protein
MCQIVFNLILFHFKFELFYKEKKMWQIVIDEVYNGIEDLYSTYPICLIS